MEIQIFERIDGNGLKFIEVYDRSGNFHRQFPYRDNKIGHKHRAWTIEKAIDYANRINSEDKRSLILTIKTEPRQ